MPGKKGMTGKGLGGHRPGAGRKPILRDTPQTTTIHRQANPPRPTSGRPAGESSGATR